MHDLLVLTSIRHVGDGEAPWAPFFPPGATLQWLPTRSCDLWSGRREGDVWTPFSGVERRTMMFERILVPLDG